MEAVGEFSAARDETESRFFRVHSERVLVVTIFHLDAILVQEPTLEGESLDTVTNIVEISGGFGEMRASF